MLNSLILAMLDFVCAFMVFHKAIPTIRFNRGRIKAFETWSLGMVLAIFGGGNLVNWMNNGQPIHWLHVNAQYLLIVYTLMRLHRIFALGIRPWWDAKVAGEIE